MSVPVAPVLSDFHVGSILMLMFSFVELSSECVLGSLCFERHRIGRELEGHRRVVAKGGKANRQGRMAGETVVRSSLSPRVQVRADGKLCFPLFGFG